ncbi:MAG: 50S ribosomal protein L24 [Chlamydiae bacterium SM23_39]|nr:MAG: 50S ribosomal protein L24 [Chlamydiae bacterium SM23_39]
MNKWLKKGDLVVVITGNDKGKKGEVLGKKKDKIIVKGVNVRKKHIKKTKETGSTQAIYKENPIHISNVALCDKNGNRIKLKVKIEKDKKELVYLEKGKEVIFRKVGK